MFNIFIDGLIINKYVYNFKIYSKFEFDFGCYVLITEIVKQLLLKYNYNDYITIL